MGEIVSFSVHHVVDGQFEQLHSQGIDTSLGIMYSLFTRYLGYVFNSDEYAVMSLCPRTAIPPGMPISSVACSRLAMAGSK
jgi:predicted NodU family carbamoyl transferase